MIFQIRLKTILLKFKENVIEWSFDKIIKITIYYIFISSK